MWLRTEIVDSHKASHGLLRTDGLTVTVSRNGALEPFATDLGKRLVRWVQAAADPTA